MCECVCRKKVGGREVGEVEGLRMTERERSWHCGIHFESWHSRDSVKGITGRLSLAWAV